MRILAKLLEMGLLDRAYHVARYIYLVASRQFKMSKNRKHFAHDLLGDEKAICLVYIPELKSKVTKKLSS